MTTYSQFLASLNQKEPESQLHPLLQALWYDACGKWKKAHEIAQEDETKMGSLVHAYLHRKEGDIENGRYWYARAGRKPSQGDLQEEWSDIVQELLGS